MLGSQKVFFNPDKNLFKRNEGKSRIVFILVGFEREGIFDMGLYKKKCSCRCQILRLYKSRYARFTKSVFNLVKDLLNEMRSRVLIWRGLEKITHVVVKFCPNKIVGMQVGRQYEKSTKVVKFSAQKAVDMQVHKKCFSI